MKPSSVESVSTTQPFTLKQTDSKFPPMRWQVKGGEATYNVDLLDSVCDCSHWRFRLFDKPEPERRCKHIEAARQHAIDLVILNTKKGLDHRFGTP